MVAKAKAGKVTAAKADRVILAAVALIECADFGEYNRASGGQLLIALDRAAGLARTVRDNAGSAR
jgi:hypothetical protein